MDESVSPAVTDMLQQGQLQELDAESLQCLKDYQGMVRAAVLRETDEPQQQERFRVITPPSLVFIAGGKTLEVMPGVRDWSDYQAAFQRYLGAPRREVSA